MRIFKVLWFSLLIGIYNNSAAQTRTFEVIYPDGTRLIKNVGNFTITDSDGNTWTLYTELDKGKTILIDIFQATCMTCLIYAPLIDQVYLKYGSGISNVNVWGLSRYDDNFMLNEFKTQYNIHHPVAGSEGNAGNAIDILIEGQNFYGTPTYAVICPDKKMYFNVCFPPTMECFDNYLINCNPVLIPGFAAAPQEMCAGGMVQFTDKSNGTISFWHWQFPGGFPEESFEINPEVLYSQPGSHSVTLTIANADTSQTLTMNDFIQIFPLPEVTLQPFDTICHLSPPVVLTGGYPEGGIYTGPGVFNGVFYPEIAGPGVHLITYEYTDSNGCTGISSEPLVVEICAGIQDKSRFSIRLSPNPTTGSVTISGLHDKNVSISVYDLQGRNLSELVFKHSTSNFTVLNLETLSEGIYVVKIHSGQTLIGNYRVILLKP